MANAGRGWEADGEQVGEEAGRGCWAPRDGQGSCEPHTCSSQVRRDVSALISRAAGGKAVIHTASELHPKTRSCPRGHHDRGTVRRGPGRVKGWGSFRA